MMSNIHVFLLSLGLVCVISFFGSLYQDYQSVMIIKCQSLTQDVLFLEQTKDSTDSDVLLVREQVRQHIKDKLSYCVDN